LTRIIYSIRVKWGCNLSNREDVIKELYLFLKDFFNDLFHDKLGFYAASMSWSSIFFIIPFMVILLVLFTYMPIFDTAYNKLHILLSESLVTTDSQAIMSYIDKFIQNTDKLGFLGVGYVIIAAILFFKDYDFIVNDIFETPKRGVFEAVRTYFALILILPLMLGGSFWIASGLEKYMNNFGLSSFFHTHILIPYLIIWLIFYISYQFSPRVTVPKKSALISSFIASLVWFIAKSLFLYYVLYNKTYTTIYGSVSTILFFFLWIYISWAIFLHGLRFCYLLSKSESNNN